MANGYNWTGYFWLATLSIPTPWGFNATVSYFASDWHPMRKADKVWWGVSIAPPAEPAAHGQPAVQGLGHR